MNAAKWFYVIHVGRRRVSAPNGAPHGLSTRHTLRWKTTMRILIGARAFTLETAWRGVGTHARGWQLSWEGQRRWFDYRWQAVQHLQTLDAERRLMAP